MRVLVAVLPFAGHVAPMQALVRELTARGHDVRVYTGSAYRSRFEDAGASVLVWRMAPDFDEHALERTFPQLRGKKGPRQLLANVEHLFIRSAAGQAQDLLAEWRSEPWDMLLSETTSVGAALAAERTTAPWVSVAITPLSLPSTALPPSGLGIRPGRGPVGRFRDRALRVVSRALTRRLRTALDETRATAGLGPSPVPFEAAGFSPTLILATGSRSLDYRRPDPPPHLHYVGTLGVFAGTPHPQWWAEVEHATAPVVHVTQGTQNLNPDDLLRPALEALADEPVLVVASSGVAGHDRLPFPVPENVRVAGLLPHAELLPRTSVMITNGGWGGTLAALSSGVPLILAGGDLDKPEVAARVGWSGAGIDLRTGTPDARQISAAFRRIRSDPSFRAAAKAVGRELGEGGGVPRAVDLIEQVETPDPGESPSAASGA
ncbi:glycosyltransferase [Lysobacter korlensis]|uniref:Glycosyltransferase n=1 Tax=Lysobacter korlensis TaxID=553636 RepID=A0ABV6RY51_9GAMM